MNHLRIQVQGLQLVSLTSTETGERATVFLEHFGLAADGGALAGTFMFSVSVCSWEAARSVRRLHSGRVRVNRGEPHLVES